LRCLNLNGQKILMSEATFCESVRQRSMDNETKQQILSKIESMERNIEQLLEILKPKNDE
jgi:hypothetical protein